MQDFGKQRSRSRLDKELQRQEVEQEEEKDLGPYKDDVEGDTMMSLMKPLPCFRTVRYSRCEREDSWETGREGSSRREA